jgi:arylsulfatase A-like enzyme
VVLMSCRAFRITKCGSNLAEKYPVTTWVGDQAVRFFQSTSEPFFLWASFSKPAFPFDPPRGYAGLYKPKDLTLPPGYRSTLAEEDADVESNFDLQAMGEPQFRKVLAYYYAAVSHLDKQVGRILATLTARGITNNLFVFCADHGDYMGEHGLILKDGAQVYDPVLRVPLIVAGKAGQRHGVVDASMVELCDIIRRCSTWPVLKSPHR